MSRRSSKAGPPILAQPGRIRGFCGRGAAVELHGRSLSRSLDPRDHCIASLIALIGRARTDLLAGLAAKVVGCLLKGLMPWRALVAGFFTTRNLAKPGMVKTPAFFSSL